MNIFSLKSFQIFTLLCSVLFAKSFCAPSNKKINVYIFKKTQPYILTCQNILINFVKGKIAYTDAQTQINNAYTEHINHNGNGLNSTDYALFLEEMDRLKQYYQYLPIRQESDFLIMVELYNLLKEVSQYLNIQAQQNRQLNYSITEATFESKKVALMIFIEKIGKTSSKKVYLNRYILGIAKIGRDYLIKTKINSLLSELKEFLFIPKSEIIFTEYCSILNQTLGKIDEDYSPLQLPKITKDEYHKYMNLFTQWYNKLKEQYLAPICSPNRKGPNTENEESVNEYEYIPHPDTHCDD